MATVAGKLTFGERRPDLLSGTPRAHSIDRRNFLNKAEAENAIERTGVLPDAIL
jgi:hypothetical protein